MRVGEEEGNRGGEEEAAGLAGECGGTSVAPVSVRRPVVEGMKNQAGPKEEGRSERRRVGLADGSFPVVTGDSGCTERSPGTATKRGGDPRDGQLRGPFLVRREGFAEVP